MAHLYESFQEEDSIGVSNDLRRRIHTRYGGSVRVDSPSSASIFIVFSRYPPVVFSIAVFVPKKGR